MHDRARDRRTARTLLAAAVLGALLLSGCDATTLLWSATDGGLRQTAVANGATSQAVYGPLPGTDETFELARSGDGTLVAHVERFVPSGPQHLAVRDLTTAPPGALPTTYVVAPSQGDDLRHLAFSPDGRRLAFTDLVGGQRHLFVVDVAEGAAATQLSTLPLAGEQRGVWSPDSSRLAWVAYDAAAPSNRVAWRDVAGGPEHRIGFDGAGTPTWSPDSTALAFVRSSSSFVHLEIRAAVTGALVAEGGWVRGLGTGTQPTWRPDGGAVAAGLGPSVLLEVGSSGTGHRLRILALSGEETELGSGVDPVWSPDGSHLAWIDAQRFIQNDPTTGAALVWREAPVLLAAGDGSGARVVSSVATTVYTTDVGGVPVEQPVTNLASVQAFSPDGTRLAWQQDTSVRYVSILPQPAAYAPDAWVEVLDDLDAGVGWRALEGTQPTFAPTGAALAARSDDVLLELAADGAVRSVAAPGIVDLEAYGTTTAPSGADALSP